MSEEDWASNAAKRFRDQIESQKLSDAMLLQEETIRQEQGPRLWAKVRENCKVLCDRLNTEYGSGIATFMVTPNSELQIQLNVPNRGVRSLRAKFKVTSADDALSWRTSGHNISDGHGGEYAIGIERGKAVFQGIALIVESPEQIAEKMLDALLSE